MSVKKVLVLPGDGIGPEQTAQAIKIINCLSKNTDTKFELEEGLIGGAAIDKTGVSLPEKTLKMAKTADAILKAPVGGAKWDNLPLHLRPEKGLLKLRKELGLFANIRPAVVFDELVDASTLKPEIVKGLDIIVLRELIGGLYFGEPKEIRTLKNGEKVGINTLTYTENEITRIIRFAFEIAQKRNKKVCSVDKSNVLETMVLWKEIANKVHKDFPDVELTHMYVDNAAMQLVKNPRQFDVLVMENMFGDILSDLASMLTGSLGMLPSASLSEPDENGKRFAMYEPVHGSAPDIAGKNIANPISMILSSALMLEYSFDMKKESDLIIKAIRKVLASGFRTKDIMEKGSTEVSTTEMGDAIVKELETLLK